LGLQGSAHYIVSGLDDGVIRPLGGGARIHFMEWTLPSDLAHHHLGYECGDMKDILRRELAVRKISEMVWLG
jgi:hypothetical protein